ncbi:hypothetical protein SARC_02126 [Sphaeroforma arctica JP610]|uniref:Uncharacterized protein n=1 Tax=Sphaeroforma arctica JP610 TaxID=667725 RepID=A0A0L0GA10_9EUKA|nr:hypothetical protein SARC_02126 [Sphaeroforma arctica JP610]KNC85716.1 hypothetical protein SARC_02126 [Sphaeroforma arctica JP610]|eukprot:XP_014159618.1 hypothetical protein SARC_02126 [Sphaeroforma arctica JP610]
MSQYYPCVVCGNEAGLICPCENRTYCTRECQVYDWGKTHFRVCTMRSNIQSREKSEGSVNIPAQAKSRSTLSKNFNKQSLSKDKDTRRASTAPYTPSDYSAFAHRPKESHRSHVYSTPGYRRGRSDSIDSLSGPLIEFSGMTLDARRRASEHRMLSPDAMSKKETRRGRSSTSNLTSASMHRSDSRSSYASPAGLDADQQVDIESTKANVLAPENVHEYRNTPGAQHESKNRTVRSYSYHSAKGSNVPLYRRDSAFSLASYTNKGADVPTQGSQSSMSSHSIDSLIGKSEDGNRYDGSGFIALPEPRPRSASSLSRSATYSSVPRTQQHTHRRYSKHLAMAKRDSGVSLEDEYRPVTRMGSSAEWSRPAEADSVQYGPRSMPRGYENMCMLTRRHTEPSHVLHARERKLYAASKPIAESEAHSEDEEIEVELLDESRPKASAREFHRAIAYKPSIDLSGPGRPRVDHHRMATTGVDSVDNRLYLDPDSRRYPCQWKGCGKRFVRRGHMQSHMRTHTGEKPFACTWEGCTSRFGQMGDLGRHMITHTGERPYPCTWPGCEKRFTTNQSKNRHYRIHTNTKKLHYCVWQDCEAQFTTKSGLKLHQRNHTVAEVAKRIPAKILPAVPRKSAEKKDEVTTRVVNEFTTGEKNEEDQYSQGEASKQEILQRPMVSA